MSDSGSDCKEFVIEEKLDAGRHVARDHEGVVDQLSNLTTIFTQQTDSCHLQLSRLFDPFDYVGRITTRAYPYRHIAPFTESSHLTAEYVNI